MSDAAHTEAGASDSLLPFDPDLDVAQAPSGSARPIHVRPIYLLIVLIGGTAGTAAREAISLAFPPVNDVPYAIFAVNVVGAFLLGVLLDALTRRGPDHGRKRTLRLLIGTGFMGGFTTYSSLATATAVLIRAGDTGVGVGYGLATVLVGGVATWCGIAVAAATHRPAPVGESR